MLKTKRDGIKRILVSAWAVVLLFSQPVVAVTIENPFLSMNGYTVSGLGTGIEPYIIKIDGENNFINEKGLSEIKEKDKESIWLVEHSKDGKTDYSLRFSGAISDLITPPFCLDVDIWQDNEGEVQVLIGENNSDFLPITLTVDVSLFEEFINGKIVTVTGGANVRTAIKDGFVEFSLDKGEGCVLTLEGYLKVPEKDSERDIKENQKDQSEKGTWDKADEGGNAVREDFVNAGSTQLPFRYDLAEDGKTLIDGASFNELKKNNQSRMLFWKDKQDKILWSYLIESNRITKVQESERFDFATSFDGKTLTVSNKGKFPCKMSTALYVGDYFKNASIVKIRGENIDTSAVVDRGYIKFWISEGGSYLLTDTGDTVKSRTVDDAKLVSESSRDNMYTTQKYKGGGKYGTRDEPLTILGKLDDFFWASWRSINTVAGYSSDMNATEASYDPSKIMNVSIEYRSPTTGKLISSITINGEEWRMTPENMKGPYYMDYKLNPSREVIENTLKSHSLYIGKYSDRREKAVESMTALSESSDTVLFLMSRTRAFAGAINYKLDVSKYFKAGDIINFRYLLGSCNGDLYHGEAVNNAELLMEEGTYSKYDGSYVVDAQGYVSFPLYTGGFFAFAKEGVTLASDDNWKPITEEKSEKPKDSKQGGEKSKTDSKPVIFDEPVKIEEEVVSKKHTETGVLTEVRDEEQLKPPNYEASSKDISVRGYLNDPNISFNMKKITDYKGACSAFGIELKKQTGFSYKMIEGEYLEVNVNLGTGYSIYDEDLLFVKNIEKNSLADEVFPAHGEIAANGEMTLTFRTTHTGDYAVYKADTKEELASAVSLKQEYTSEATALLAEQSLKKEDKAKTIIYLIAVTFVILLGAVIITDIRRRRPK